MLLRALFGKSDGRAYDEDAESREALAAAEAVAAVAVASGGRGGEAADDGGGGGGGGDASARECRQAVAWLQELLPDIGARRGAQAQAHVAPFLQLFHRFQHSSSSAQGGGGGAGAAGEALWLADVQALLPHCCLRNLDSSLEKLVKDGYVKLGGGCGPSEALRANRVASALIRFVCATAQGVLLRTREGQLNRVGAEVLRCRANVPAVHMRI